MLKWFKRKKYNYHVTFICQVSNSELSFKDQSIEVGEKITFKAKSIRRIKDFLKSEHKATEVVILNIIKI